MSVPLDDRTAVLADPHPMWMDAIEHVLRGAGIDVVAKECSSTAALERLESARVDLLITDVEFGNAGTGGVSFLRRARERAPEVRIVVLSAREDADAVDAAFGAGADAYVVKTADAEDLTSAVRQVFQHSIFLAHNHGGAMAAANAVGPVGSLTARETEILQLVAEGHSNAELARRLWVSEQTVKFHLSNVYRKLNVSNRTEASRWARVTGVSPAPAARGVSAAG